MRYYRLAVQKHYFDKGYSSSHYVFKAVSVFGIAAQEVALTIWFGFLFGIFCYLFGRWSYRFGFSEAEQEVINKIDPFVKEMRKRHT